MKEKHKYIPARIRQEGFVSFFDGTVPHVHGSFHDIRTDTVAFDKADDRIIRNLQTVGTVDDILSLCGTDDV